ncbi:MAG: patatin-like phospholipase family protein [Beijerinckiaceae bacterium]
MPQLPPEGGPKQARIEGPQEVRAFDDRGAGGRASLDHAPGATDEAEPTVKEINLALQGGGAHGAFAWGVLDCLLEDGRLAFEGISATSAGAVNAALCASGMLRGGREGARLALRDFWRAVANAGETYRPMPSNWLAMLSGTAQLNQAHLHSFLQLSNEAFSSYLASMTELNPFLQVFVAKTGTKRKLPSRSFASHIFDALNAMFSPYYFNPANYNLLKDLLAAHVDFAALRAAHDSVKLRICATNVETGKIRVFKNAELTADAVLASTCLPFLFQAVEIDGEYYWDGGYMGNPAIFPLIYETQSCDVVIIHIDPLVRKGCPKTTLEIMNRLNEVSFNSSLMREMRAIAFVNRLIDTGKVKEGEMKRMRMHAIRADSAMSQLGAFSKTDTDWEFLRMLFAAGRKAATEWLDQNHQWIGRESTVDLKSDYL